MRRNFAILGFVVFILLTAPVRSLEFVNFEDANGRTFYPGDFVDLGTVLINNETGKVNLTVEQYVIRPEIAAMPLYEEFVIEPDNDVMISDLSFEVSEYSSPGEYTHVVRVYKMEELVAENVKAFYVSGTKDRLSEIELMICADSGCGDVRPVFSLGETAYILVECLENPEISGYIDRGGIETTTLSFDNGLASFKAGSVGTYTVNVTLSKEGFFTEALQREITFLEGEEEPAGEIAATGGYEYVIAIVTVVIILIIIVGLFFLKRKG